MDPKDFSPAYLTSLVSIFIGAILAGGSPTFLWVLGWLLLAGGLGLNVFATMVMIQRFKGGPLPALISGESEEADEDEEDSDLPEPEPVTEAQEVVEPASQESAGDERIFRSRTKPRPPVR